MGAQQSAAAFVLAGAILVPLIAGVTPGAAARRPAAPPAPPKPAAQAPAPPHDPGLLANGNQMVVYYGSPRSTGMGVLGWFGSADGAAKSLAGETALVDSLNGDRTATGAMDVIYGMVSSDPGPNGIYVRYLDEATTRQYIDTATKHNQQVFLDMQIGRGSVLGEVQKLAPFLTNPNVHVAIDPEYAVGPNGIPIQTPGHITGEDINQAQEYLARFAVAHHLPPKILLVHQYINGTVYATEGIKLFQNVRVALNYDGIGSPAEKLQLYRKFTTQPWVQKRGYMVFLHADSKVSSEQDVLALNPSPDMIMFQ